jgi:hypothetical protein
VTGWEDRLRAARAACAAAAALERQAIRDAKAGGATPTEIAAVLGVRNRQRIYGILADEELGEVPNPALTPVAFLRGAGRGPEAWTAVERALRSRGLHATHDRLSAWHLSRGGTPVVLADFSGDVDGEIPVRGGGYLSGYARQALIGLCRAKYDADGSRLLALVNGGRYREAYMPSGDLDADVIARLAADALHAGKAAAGEPEDALLADVLPPE